MAKTSDVVKIIDRMIGDDAKLRQQVAEERLNAEIAQAIYDARTAAGLTQRQLAERIGTKQPVIARLEDADYDGHSLSILVRIAKALGLQLSVKMLPEQEHAGGRKRHRKRMERSSIRQVVGVL